MDEHPAIALREKKDASILVAMDLVRRGEADAVVTAGHTGAGMAAAVLRLGRLRGVDRPALAIQMVGTENPFVLLDIGANPDSTPENLAQYARMGAIFSERVLGVARPRVALLSIGEEKGKGDARIMRATELLDETDLNFIGNVEGKDLTQFSADVVVCDAVLGNVVIKFFEGLSGYIFDLLKAEFSRLDPRPPGVPADAPRDQADPHGLRLRGGRRLAAAGRPGFRDHHPRPREAAHDRACRPRGCHDGSRAGPGADRRGAGRRRAPRDPTRPTRPTPRRQAPDVNPLGRPRRDPGDGPARCARGPGRHARRARRTALARRASPARPCASACATGACT